MLSMDSRNCAKYAEKMEKLSVDANDNLEKEMNLKFNSIWRKMLTQEVSGSEMCNYLDWAYYARVNLDGDMEAYKTIHETLCQDYYNSMTHAYITVDWSDNGMISNSFMNKLLEIL